MSVQFGRWNFEGQQPSLDYTEKVSAVLAPYGPDGNGAYSKGGMKILYYALHTTRESHRETQPYVSPAGAVITWDGRLDNRTELVTEFRNVLSIDSTDVAIVAVAYEKWGVDCFANLIGDWALSIWNPINRSLVLAKDVIGTHHLYYSFEQDHVTWSTLLDPLVLFAGKRFAICEEYIAYWFSSLPAAHLTPYVGIQGVPPSSSVLLQPQKQGVKHIVTKYWDFDPGKRIRYRTDAEYEEHFRVVLATAVQRRLRSDHPVLAELSGGMDSSSIVCMADLVMAHGETECPRLDTISYFDDSDPDWYEERFYLTKVEQKRGRTGYHIDLGIKTEIQKREAYSRQSFFRYETNRLAATPDSTCDLWPDIFEHYIPYVRSQGYRVTLSGIGGEDSTGGFVPTSKPEFQNLLAGARFVTLARQLKAWAAKTKKPALVLLWEAVRGFFPRAGVSNVPPWFSSGFVRRNHATLCCCPFRVKLFGPLPSFQDHIHGLNRLRSVLSYHGGLRYCSEMLREVRYPYSDRDLLEFAYAIPQEQIVGVGKRRFLMKRALVGIVPDELINRKTRAPSTKEPTKDSSIEWPSLAEIEDHFVSSSVGIVESNRLLETLLRALRGEEVAVDNLVCTLKLEFWLRHLTIRQVLTNSMITKSLEYPSSLEAQERQPHNTSSQEFS